MKRTKAQAPRAPNFVPTLGCGHDGKKGARWSAKRGNKKTKNKNKINLMHSSRYEMELKDK